METRKGLVKIDAVDKGANGKDSCELEWTTC